MSTTLKQRTAHPEQILSENINTYVSTYQDDWGYKITQKVSKVQKSSDGSAYATGFSYYDKDEGHEVTLINLVTKLKDSSLSWPMIRPVQRQSAG